MVKLINVKILSKAGTYFYINNGAQLLSSLHTFFKNVKHCFISYAKRDSQKDKVQEDSKRTRLL